jgi:hypothetical protein
VVRGGGGLAANLLSWQTVQRAVLVYVLYSHGRTSTSTPQYTSHATQPEMHVAIDLDVAKQAGWGLVL